MAIRTAALKRVGGGSSWVRFGLVAIAVLYLGVLVIAPAAGIVLSLIAEGWAKVRETLSLPDVRHAYWLTFVITMVTVSTTTVFGVLTAWVLVRHNFPGRKFLNAL